MLHFRNRFLTPSRNDIHARTQHALTKKKCYLFHSTCDDAPCAGEFPPAQHDRGAKRHSQEHHTQQKHGGVAEILNLQTHA